MPVRAYSRRLKPLFRFVVLAATLCLICACIRRTPQDFASGEYLCEFCQMNIVQMEFKAEILSPKGKVHRFDSIECMLTWAKAHPEDVETRWVTDFNNPRQWVAFEKAGYLKSDRRPSPMGGNLSAYATTAATAQARQEVGGEIVTSHHILQQKPGDLIPMGAYLMEASDL